MCGLATSRHHRPAPCTQSLADCNRCLFYGDSTAEAAVATEVGEKRTKEFQRYGLQKGLWNRLLSPAKAWAREKALEEDLEAEDVEAADQLPGEQYEMHPLWQEVVESCEFAEYGPVRHSKRREHINLKEVSAALAAEEKHGQKHPSTYFVNLQDSQVSLACLVKGRSSSWAISKKLRKSLPTHLSHNTRPVYGYVRSKLNPGDDPTRDQPVRKARKQVPDWWEAAGREDYAKFDAFMEKFGADVGSMADLPPRALLLSLPRDQFEVSKKSLEVWRRRLMRGRDCWTSFRGNVASRELW